MYASRNLSMNVCVHIVWNYRGYPGASLLPGSVLVLNVDVVSAKGAHMFVEAAWQFAPSVAKFQSCSREKLTQHDWKLSIVCTGKCSSLMWRMYVHAIYRLSWLWIWYAVAPVDTIIVTCRPSVYPCINQTATNNAKRNRKCALTAARGKASFPNRCSATAGSHMRMPATGRTMPHHTARPVCMQGCVAQRVRTSSEGGQGDGFRCSWWLLAWRRSPNGSQAGPSGWLLPPHTPAAWREVVRRCQKEHALEGGNGHYLPAPHLCGCLSSADIP